jgi:hypothetical protein
MIANWYLQSFFSVNFLGIEHPFSDDFESFGSDLAEEAAFVSFVTCRTADLIDLEEDRVAVAIDVDGFHRLDVTAFFAFSPELLPAPTVIDRPAGGDGFGVTFGVHVGLHQDFTGLGILGNGGQQSVAAGKIRSILKRGSHGYSMLEKPLPRIAGRSLLV